MNEKITLPSLTQYFAIQTGDSKKQSEDFIREFFALVSETVVDGDQVKIKDFGVFKTITVEARKSVNVSTGEDHEIPQHRKIVFVPSKEIAALVNEPFEMFETVEVNDDVDLEDTAEPEIPAEPEATEEPEATDESEAVEETEEPEVAEETEVIEEQKTDEERQSIEETSESVVERTEADIDEDNVYTVEDTDDEQSGSPVIEQSERMADEVCDDQDDYDDEDDEMRRQGRPRRFLWGFLTGFMTAVVAGILIMVAMRFMWVETLPLLDGDDIEQTDTIAATDTDRQMPVVVLPAPTIATTTAISDTGAHEEIKTPGETVPTEPSDKKVYDTITKTRYLTTMAKDHYGNFNLWPYIYIENKAFLGHPDRIRPGTQVVIPPLSKYGVDPKNPADIAEAKKKGVEIYSHYK